MILTPAHEGVIIPVLEAKTEASGVKLSPRGWAPAPSTEHLPHPAGSVGPSFSCFPPHPKSHSICLLRTPVPPPPAETLKVYHLVQEIPAHPPAVSSDERFQGGALRGRPWGPCLPLQQARSLAVASLRSLLRPSLCSRRGDSYGSYPHPA